MFLPSLSLRSIFAQNASCNCARRRSYNPIRQSLLWMVVARPKMCIVCQPRVFDVNDVDVIWGSIILELQVVLVEKKDGNLVAFIVRNRSLTSLRRYNAFACVLDFQFLYLTSKSYLARRSVQRTSLRLGSLMLGSQFNDAWSKYAVLHTGGAECPRSVGAVHFLCAPRAPEVHYYPKHLQAWRIAVQKIVDCSIFSAHQSFIACIHLPCV